eukprot:924132-Pelagomonas_calceolata.AAC.2
MAGCRQGLCLEALKAGNLGYGCLLMTVVQVHRGKRAIAGHMQASRHTSAVFAGLRECQDRSGLWGGLHWHLFVNRVRAECVGILAVPSLLVLYGPPDSYPL